MLRSVRSPGEIKSRLAFHVSQERPFSLFLSRGGRKGKETGYKTSHLVQLTVFLSNGSGGFFIYGENVVGRGEEGGGGGGEGEGGGGGRGPLFLLFP